ncbi:hypothetical protein KIPB_009771, partial [Kipferlia bialata]
QPLSNTQRLAQAMWPGFKDTNSDEEEE